MQTLSPPSKNLAVWLMATRPQFFTVIILPIFLGTAIAWHQQGVFFPDYFALALLGGILAHAGVNVLNDYFDHLNRTDEFNTEPLTPFAGGSRMIQNRLLSPRETFRYGLLLLLAVGLIGVYLVWARGLPLLAIGLAGVLSGYFYSSPPLALNSRGWGEFLVGLNFGVLAVLGAYYVQAQSLDGGALVASLPLGLLVAAILYINEFPDYEADRRAGKCTLVVRLGQARARLLFLGIVLGSFVALLLGIVLGFLPWLTALALLAVPLGVKAVHTLYIAYDQKLALVPGIKSTILLHTTFGLCLILGFIV